MIDSDKYSAYKTRFVQRLIKDLRHGIRYIKDQGVFNLSIHIHITNGVIYRMNVMYNVTTHNMMSCSRNTKKILS